MLVLTRRSRESVVVGDPVDSLKQSLKVTVLEIRYDKVKLGFEAGGDIAINRWEVWKNLHSSVDLQRQQPDQMAFAAH